MPVGQQRLTFCCASLVFSASVRRQSSRIGFVNTQPSGVSLGGGCPGKPLHTKPISAKTLFFPLQQKIFFFCPPPPFPPFFFGGGGEKGGFTLTQKYALPSWR